MSGLTLPRCRGPSPLARKYRAPFRGQLRELSGRAAANARRHPGLIAVNWGATLVVSIGLGAQNRPGCCLVARSLWMFVTLPTASAGAKVCGVQLRQLPHAESYRCKWPHGAAASQPCARVPVRRLWTIGHPAFSSTATCSCIPCIDGSLRCAFAPPACAGAVYSGLTRDSGGIQNRLGSLAFMTLYLGVMGLSSLPIWRAERLLFIRCAVVLPLGQISRKVKQLGQGCLRKRDRTAIFAC